MHLQRTLLNKKSKLQRTQIFCCHFDKVQKEAKFSKLDSLKIILHIIVKEYRTVSDKVNFHRAVHCGGGKGTKIVKLRVQSTLWLVTMFYVKKSDSTFVVLVELLYFISQMYIKG